MLTACYGPSGRKHDASDVALLQEVARRAAVALRNARLYGYAQETARHAEQAARQAEQAGRLKDEFLATVSHELRTPLSSILGWTKILRSDRAQADKGLDIIEHNARWQQRILEDILDVSRIIAGKLRIDTEPVDFVALARDVVDSARPVAGQKRVELFMHANEPSCRLAGDGSRLRQVIANLVSNAVKFTPEGGRVDVTVEQSGDRIVVSVQDSGRGIDRAFLPHVFERFSQSELGGGVTRGASGLGLGLAIARHLVDIHGGSIGVTSEGLGRGATFTVTLPVKPFSAPVRGSETMPDSANGATPSRGRSNRLESLRVLVVEDEVDSRDLIELLLESEGAIVSSASSADAALERLPGFRPDIVLSDVGMPGHDGYWLVQQIRAIDESLPTVALTAYASEDDIARAMAAGFDHHVGKPVDPEHLVRALVGAHRRPPSDGNTTAA
jgi:signal transduction histidine kinase/CheY-like chemotaxis protein